MTILKAWFSAKPLSAHPTEKALTYEDGMQITSQEAVSSGYVLDSRPEGRWAVPPSAGKKFLRWLRRQRFPKDLYGVLGSDIRQDPEARQCESIQELLTYTQNAACWGDITDDLEGAWSVFLGDDRAQFSYDVPARECAWCEEELPRVLAPTLVLNWWLWPTMSWECATPFYFHGACVAAFRDQPACIPGQRESMETVHNILHGPLREGWKRCFPCGFWQVLREEWASSGLDGRRSAPWAFLHTLSVPVPSALTSQQRFAILKRDGYRCRLCGIAAYDAGDVRLEVDHILAKSQGGTNDPDNLWTLCFRCNRGKHINDL